MKRAYFVLVSLILTGGISSCGKTSKGKLSNEWTVTASEEKTVNSYPGGSITQTTTVSGNSFSLTSIIDELPSTVNGNVNKYEYTIQKDGTWSAVKDFTEISSSSNQTTHRSEISGTWSFVIKNSSDDFKKNEKVIFNILKETHTTKQVVDGQVVTSSAEGGTYLTGENGMLFTVVESKSKKLQFKFESKHISSSNGSSNSTFTDGSFTMEQK